MEYTSFEIDKSSVAPGVSYTVAKISFGRRVELTRRIRELAARKEFLEAGEHPNEKMDAALLASEIDRIYLLWGLTGGHGSGFGWAARQSGVTCGESGPEELFREALAAVKHQCGLSEAERKN